MRAPEEIAARIKMLRDDSKNLRARLRAANDDKRYAVASHCHTAMACAETMISALEWAMEGPSPAPAEWIGQVKLMIAYAEAMGFWVLDNEMSVDDIFANLDRIAAQFLPAPAWQPIATAPKDGTEVDLWFKDGNESYRFADARWIDGKWCTFDHETDSWEGIGELGDLAYATHWQPLPAPPQADEVETGKAAEVTG